MEEMERFGLTEEEKMLQDMVRRLAREKVAPGAEEREKRANTRGTCSKSCKKTGSWELISRVNTKEWPRA